MTTKQKKRPLGRPIEPMPKIDAPFEDILKAVVTPIRKDKQ